MVAFTSPRHTDLCTLAHDARRRGHESLALSVEGVTQALEVEDPVHVALVHDLWKQAARPDLGLTHLLGAADTRVEHDAFHAAVCLRVLRAIESWFEEMTALADAGGEEG